MRITVIGNCQARSVAQAIEAAVASDASVQVHSIASYLNVGDDDLEIARTSEIIVEQITDDDDRSRSQSPLADCKGRRVLFPLLEGSFLYPFSTKAHPRASEAKSRFMPQGFYETQMSDTELIKLMRRREGDPPEHIADLYLALDFSTLIDLDALMAASREKAERLKARCDYDSWTRIDCLFRYQPIFWTRLHPSEVLLRPLCRSVLERMDLGLTEAEVEAASKQVYDLGFGHMPVHPSLAAHHGMEWVTPRTLYRVLQEGAFSARDYAIRFVTFAHDGQLAEALGTLHASQDKHHALGHLLEALERHPNNGELLMNIAVGFCSLGDVPNAYEAAVSALSLEPHRSDWVALVCHLSRLLIPERQLTIADLPKVDL